MTSIKKTFIAAGVLFAVTATVFAQDSDPTTQAPASSTSHFDLSPNACYNRMQQVDLIRREKFSLTDGPWAALVNHSADDSLFGLPLSGWDDALVNEFYASVEACMEPEGMKTEFGAGLPDKVRAYFPDYLARLRQQADRAVRFKENAASSSGTAASCPELVDYADKKANPGRSGFGNTPFGKRLATYEDTDFRFLNDRIDTCVRLMKDAAAGKGELDGQISHMLALQKEISTEWREEQRNLVPAEQAATQAREEQTVAAVEHERRKTAPTMMERIGDYMAKVGFVGIMLCIATSAKKDRRFKGGYRPDWVPQKPMRIVFISSVALIFLGWVIG